MALANDKLSTAARAANEIMAAHAKQLRNKDENVSDAIAKMQQVRGHAHQLGELMLAYAPSDEAPDRKMCWNAFSGLLDEKRIKEADWGEKTAKKPASSSHAVYDISKFNSITGSASMASPAPHVAYHLIATKVKQSALEVDYEPLPPVTIAAFKGKGKPVVSAKRKAGEINGSGEEEEEEDEESGEDSD